MGNISGVWDSAWTGLAKSPHHAPNIRAGLTPVLPSRHLFQLLDADAVRVDNVLGRLGLVGLVPGIHQEQPRPQAGGL